MWRSGERCRRRRGRRSSTSTSGSARLRRRRRPGGLDGATVVRGRPVRRATRSARLSGGSARVLAALVTEPDPARRRRVGIAVLDEPSERRVLASWNDTAAPVPGGHAGRSCSQRRRPGRRTRSRWSRATVRLTYARAGRAGRTGWRTLSNARRRARSRWSGCACRAAVEMIAAHAGRVEGRRGLPAVDPGLAGGADRVRAGRRRGARSLGREEHAG